MANNKPRLVTQHLGAAGAGEAPPALGTRATSLSGLIDASSDPMVLIRPDGAILWVNPSACAQLGRTRDELHLLPFATIAEDYKKRPLATAIIRSNALVPVPLEANLARADGSSWPVTLHASEIVIAGEAAILLLASDRRNTVVDKQDAIFALSGDFAGEGLLAAVSIRLVQATSDDLDVPIRVSLAQLCQTLGAHHGEVLLLNSLHSVWTSSYCWFASPLLRSPLGGQTLPIGQLGWTWRQLLLLETVVAQQGVCLPVEACGDRLILDAAGFASVVFAPLVHGGQILGCLVLSRTRIQQPWRDVEVALIRSVADLFATSIERQRMQIEINGRLQYESLVGNIASSLLRTPANLLDPGIEQALQRLAEYLRADHAAVVLLSDEGRRFGISHEVCATGPKSARETVQDLPTEGFLPPGRKLLPTDVLMIPDLQALPEEIDETRRLFALFGIRSALAVPLVLGSEVVGGIVIGCTGPGYTWDERQVALLRACADIIITTIQQLRIEQALRESDEKFSRTFLAMPDAVAITEVDGGRIIEANPALETSLGFTLSQSIGYSAIELGFLGSADEYRLLVEDTMRHGVVRNRELLIRRTSGEATNVLLSAVKIELRGKPYLCTVLRDVTAAKAAEQALRAAEGALRELNSELEARVRSRTAELETSLRELESFSYSVSHDLRSPLRGINGFASLLAEEYGDRLDDNARDYLLRITSATVRMGNLIDELLDLSRIARLPMQKTRVDLAAVARSIAHELRENEPQRDVEVVIARRLPVLADFGLIHVVLSNLLGNAWKFTGGVDRARIELGSRTVNGEQQIFVCDNGAGFDMANYQLLFRPFSRLHRPTEFPGTGIGLVTVARIVERHGGRIWAQGRVGQGASFYFTLG